ncbi:hypothetical protein ABH903_001287 [Brevibacterium epidermidis]|uniref:Uncharacterized protein n=1 Tax=Brevibacterium epidermidis TaxID=1698 RepID=A0ABV4EIR9_BREEP
MVLAKEGTASAMDGDRTAAAVHVEAGSLGHLGVGPSARDGGPIRQGGVPTGRRTASARGSPHVIHVSSSGLRNRVLVPFVERFQNHVMIHRTTPIPTSAAAI